MAEDKQITRMRGVGRFFGHVWHAIASPASDKKRVEVRRDVEEERREGITLRRTTIEEIELPAEGARTEDRR